MTDEISSGVMKQVNCKFSHFAFIAEFKLFEDMRTEQVITLIECINACCVNINCIQNDHVTHSQLGHTK